MSAYETDKEQIEMIKKWWNDYGKALLIAIIIGLALGFGWRYWRQHKVEVSQQASGIYQSMTIAAEKQDEKTATVLADKLMKDFSNTAYASLAGLLSAKNSVEQKQLKQAYQDLQWVIKNSDVKSFRQIARIRAARILIAENKAKAALKLLSTVDDKSYAPLTSEVKGDAYASLNNKKAALEAYKAANLGLLEMGMTNPLLQMKMAQPL